MTEPLSRLRHATPKELAAAVRSATHAITEAINAYMSGGIASMWRDRAIGALQSADGQKKLAKIVDDALDAAEAEREKSGETHDPH